MSGRDLGRYVLVLGFLALIMLTASTAAGFALRLPARQALAADLSSRLRADYSPDPRDRRFAALAPGIIDAAARDRGAPDLRSTSATATPTPPPAGPAGAGEAPGAPAAPGDSPRPGATTPPPAATMAPAPTATPPAGKHPAAGADADAPAAADRDPAAAFADGCRAPAHARDRADASAPADRNPRATDADATAHGHAASAFAHTDAGRRPLSASDSRHRALSGRRRLGGREIGRRGERDRELA